MLAGIEFSDNLNANQIIPGLWLGTHPYVRDYVSIRNRRIKAILTIEDKELPYVSFHFKYLFIPAVDDLKCDLIDSFEVAFNFIEENINNGVLVHCWTGRSRSAAIVIGYLMWKFRIAYEEALNVVNEKRSIYPNKNFVYQLRHLEAANFNFEEAISNYSAYRDHWHF